MLKFPRLFKTMILAMLAGIAYGQSSSSDPYTWAPVAPALTIARADACAAALLDGSALVTGGVGNGGSAIASVDRFVAGTGFAAATAMSNARAGHSCTPLKDGRVLGVGGGEI